MKLLNNVEFYCIKVDYYMWSEKKGEYTEPVYLSIDYVSKRKDQTPANWIIFEEEIGPGLRIFDSKVEAISYMDERIKNPSYCENQRVVKIIFDFENGKWKEV